MMNAKPLRIAKVESQIEYQDPLTGNYLLLTVHCSLFTNNRGIYET